MKMWMMKHFLGLIAVVISTTASADTYYTVVGYQCALDKDAIIFSYHGAYNEAGEKLVNEMGENQWDLWSLVEGKPIKKKCVLDKKNYEITISTYLTGSQCKACFGINVKVTLRDKVVFNEGLDGFEEANETIITNATLKSHSDSIELTRIPWKDIRFKSF